MAFLLHEWLPDWVRKDPLAPLAASGDRTLARGEALECVEQLAKGLVASGVARGERVAVVARNGIDPLLVALAVARVGAVPAPLNPRLAPAEWRFLVDDAEAGVVFADAELAAPLGEALQGSACVRMRVALPSPPDEAQPVPPGWHRLDDWAARGSGAPLPRAEDVAAADDDAVQLATSGTTGRPKGVVLTQRALDAAVSHWRQLYPVGDGDRELLVMPMHHSGGLLFALHAVRVGASLRILRDFDPVEVLDRLATEPIVRVTLVPTMIERCLEAAQRSGAPRPRSLRILTYGGSPITPASLERALAFFDCDFSQAYGLSELPSLTYLRPEHHRRALAGEPQLLGSVGVPAPGCELRIVDEAGRTLEPGETGEIVGRGPQQMRGYWKRPRETADTLRDGWVHTGDAGRLDAQGLLTIVDRIKDVIVTGGENVASREVEDALAAHPAVREVAAIGTPSERWGEQVTAVVALAEGAAVGVAELEAFCSERIAAWKRPRRIEFVAELPRNASGKVLKRDLRERFGAGT